MVLATGLASVRCACGNTTADVRVDAMLASDSRSFQVATRDRDHAVSVLGSTDRAAAPLAPLASTRLDGALRCLDEPGK